MNTEFDCVYSVSDLHIGGRPGFQIFSGTEAFPAFVRFIAAHAKDRVALVINGDFIDFLAEAPFLHFDLDGAAGKLQRIGEDPGFSECFRALGEFVATKNCHLLINLGNHDLELALPAVQTEFIQLLAAGGSHSSATIKASVHWFTGGTGLRLSVAGARILFVHGNTVDDWNQVDHAGLAEVAGTTDSGAARERLDSMRINAGTRLVIDAMNDIKATYPFVDLLKPEQEACFWVLAAIDPAAIKKFSNAGSALVELVTTKMRRLFGLLGTSPSATAVSNDVILLDPALLLHAARKRNQQGTSPYDLVDDRTRTVGYFSAPLKWVKGEGRDEVLRDLLESIDARQDFNFAVADAADTEVQHANGRDWDILVAGHSHFERSVPMLGKHYFNTGTWAYLMRIDQATRSRKQEFARLVKDLTDAKTIDALWRRKRLMTRHSFVCVRHVPGKGVLGSLERFEGRTTIPVSESKYFAGK